MRSIWTAFRRVLPVGVLAVLVVTVVGLQPAGAGGPYNFVTVKVVVEGTAPGPFSITMVCDEGTQNELRYPLVYTAAGVADEAASGPFEAPDHFIEVVDGSFVLQSYSSTESCTVTQTDSSGATTVSYACTYSTQEDLPGAAAAAGCSATASATPITVTWEGSFNTYNEATVTITNAFVPEAAEPVDLEPAFTG